MNRESPAFNHDDIAARYAAGVDTAPYNALYERPAVSLHALARARELN